MKRKLLDYLKCPSRIAAVNLAAVTETDGAEVIEGHLVLLVNRSIQSRAAFRGLRKLRGSSPIRQLLLPTLAGSGNILPTRTSSTRNNKNSWRGLGRILNKKLNLT
jgi:hypothetical protein